MYVDGAVSSGRRRQEGRQQAMGLPISPADGEAGAQRGSQALLPSGPIRLAQVSPLAPLVGVIRAAAASGATHSRPALAADPSVAIVTAEPPRSPDPAPALVERPVDGALLSYGIGLVNRVYQLEMARTAPR
jgi:hypothetical protein